MPALIKDGPAPTNVMKQIIERMESVTRQNNFRLNCEKIYINIKIKIVILNPESTIMCERPETRNAFMSSFVKREEFHFSKKSKLQFLYLQLFLQ